jgi:hypothetical protein
MLEQPEVSVKYFKPNAARLLALLESVALAENDAKILIELVVTGDRSNKYITLEDVSVVTDSMGEPLRDDWRWLSYYRQEMSHEADIHAATSYRVRSGHDCIGGSSELLPGMGQFQGFDAQVLGFFGIVALLFAFHLSPDEEETRHEEVTRLKKKRKKQ